MELNVELYIDGNKRPHLVYFGFMSGWSKENSEFYLKQKGLVKIADLVVIKKYGLIVDILEVSFGANCDLSQEDIKELLSHVKLIKK